jgi:hypothetical protein
MTSTDANFRNRNSSNPLSVRGRQRYPKVGESEKMSGAFELIASALI